MPKKIFIVKIIPKYVATPFPPLNFTHIGNKCPKKTHSEEINIISGKLYLIYNLEK